MREVKFYKTISGKNPIEDFLDSLQFKQAQRVAWVIEIIEEIDRIPKQYFKKLINTDDIWEIRVQTGNTIFRLLSFFDGNDLIIACHGFVKKSQKVPKKEIEIAEKRKRDYFRGKRNE